jgi:hypothetical protein
MTRRKQPHASGIAGRSRRNRISGQWSPRLIEMLMSPAYRVLSLSAHRVMARIEIELGNHGGNNNGALPVTKQQFIDYGIDHNSIAPAIRELEALGFISYKRGRGGNAEHRKPNLFRLTFAHDRNSAQEPPTHDWRKIKTLDEANEIASAARANRARPPSKPAVAKPRSARGDHHPCNYCGKPGGITRPLYDDDGVWLHEQCLQDWKDEANKSRYGKIGPKPVRENRSETEKSSVRENRSTRWGRKPVLLSISPSRAGGREVPAAGCLSSKDGSSDEVKTTKKLKTK